MNNFQKFFNEKLFNMSSALIFIMLGVLLGIATGITIAINVNHTFSAKALIQIGQYTNTREYDPFVLIEPIPTIAERISAKSYHMRISAKFGQFPPREIDRIMDTIRVRELQGKGFIEIQLNAPSEKLAKDILTEITQDILQRHKKQMDEFNKGTQAYVTEIRSQLRTNIANLNTLFEMQKTHYDPKNAIAIVQLNDSISYLNKIRFKLESATQGFVFNLTTLIEDVSTSDDLYYTNIKTYAEVGVILGFLLGLFVYYFIAYKKQSIKF